MSTTVRSERVPVLPDGDTRVGPPGSAPTPLPAEFPFLRPAVAPGELGRLGPYRVVRLLGAGGMGKVFLAEDPALKRDVALKVMCLPPGEDVLSWRERFLREARAQAATRHPNLVAVYQVGEDRGTVYLAMELLEGETLEARIRRDPLDVPTVLRVGEEVAKGLEAIHQRGLIHRDIKPANIWLCAARSAECGARSEEQTDADAESAESATRGVKILDFGLVREVTADTHLTEAGAVMGTPAYMSPEQVRGKPLDHRTDLFSFGCVLYAMCTGKAPFASSNPMAQAAALAADEPTRVRKLNPAVPPTLSKLIAELLAKDPDDRPRSAAEVVERLRAIGSDEPAPKPQSKPRSFFRRHAVKLVALVWVVLAVLVVVAATRGKRGAEQRPDAPAPAASVIFLSELRKVEDRVFPPAGAPRPPGESEGVRVGGKRSPHGLFMHGAPPLGAPAFASYALDGRFSRFTADVGLNDSAGKWAGLIFVVFADEKQVWSSGNIASAGQTERCDVDVTGVSVLRLEVRTMGPHLGAHGAWVEPRLTP